MAVIDVERVGAKRSPGPDAAQPLPSVEHPLSHRARELSVPGRVEPGERCLDRPLNDQLPHALAVRPHEARPFADQHRFHPGPEPQERAPDMARNGEATEGAKHLAIEAQLAREVGWVADVALNTLASEFGKRV